MSEIAMGLFAVAGPNFLAYADMLDTVSLQHSMRRQAVYAGGLGFGFSGWEAVIFESRRLA